MQSFTHGLQAVVSHLRPCDVSALAADSCSGSLFGSVTVRWAHASGGMPLSQFAGAILLTEMSEESVLVFTFDRESTSAELT
eukprot:4765212-Pleurochrysis_carterae.AAC.1